MASSDDAAFNGTAGGRDTGGDGGRSAVSLCSLGSANCWDGSDVSRLKRVLIHRASGAEAAMASRRRTATLMIVQLYCIGICHQYAGCTILIRFGYSRTVDGPTFGISRGAKRGDGLRARRSRLRRGSPQMIGGMVVSVRMRLGGVLNKTVWRVSRRRSGTG